MTEIRKATDAESIQAILGISLRYEECKPETELEEVVITNYEWHGDGMNMTFATDEDIERFQRLWYADLPFRLVVRKQ